MRTARRVRVALFVLLIILLPAAVLAQTQPPPADPNAPRDPNAPADPNAPKPPPPQPPPPPPTQPQPSRPSRLFFGGSLGASFGSDVEYWEISPLIGISLTPRLSTGTYLTYRQGTDKRYANDFDFTDYGADLFARFRFARALFLEADYQWLSYERLLTPSDSDRDTYDAFFVGGGLAQPMGGHAAFVIEALYNLNYDDNNINEPYDSPYVVRAGVSVGF